MKKSFFKRIFGSDKSNADNKQELSKTRRILLESLEPRILYSAAPAAAPTEAPEAAPADQTEHVAPAAPAPAAPAPVAPPQVEPTPVAEVAPAETSEAPDPVIEGELPTAQEAILVDEGAAEPVVDPSATENVDETEQQASPALVNSDLQPIVQAAIDRWEASGLSSEQLEALRNVTYQVLDLGGDYLGAAEGFSITIDDDAAGADWFIDQSPMDDGEFVVNVGVDTAMVAGEDSDAHGRVDLLSIVLHEQGHVLGLDEAEVSTSVMYQDYDVSERRLPAVGEADGAVVGSLEGIHYATLNWDEGGADQDWATAENWSGDTVPLAADRADIQSNGTTGTLGDTTIPTAAGAGAAEVSGTETIDDVYVGRDNTHGRLDVLAGGHLTVTDNFYLGNDADNGSGVPETGTMLILGTVDLTGDGLRIGNAGHAFIEVGTGGVLLNNHATADLNIANSAGSEATINVTGGTVTAVNDRINVGNAGNGWINQSAGSVQAATLVLIGDDAGSTGTYVLSGGTLETIGNTTDPDPANHVAAGDIRVGNNGFGTLTMTDGTINAGEELIVGSGEDTVNASTSVANISGGVVNVVADFEIGNNAGSKGEVNISGTADVNGGNHLMVGRAGVGTLTMSGGTLDLAQDLYVSDSAGSAGSVATFSGGITTIGDQLRAGEDATTSGTINISGTAVVNAADDVRIGHNGIGTFTMSGGTLNAADVFIVSNSAGSAGSVASMSGGTLNINTSLQIGAAAGSSGTFNYSGGTFQDISADIRVGQSGTGVLNIDAGTFTPADAHVYAGFNAGSNGTINVDDGATLQTDTASYGVRIGRLGTGTMQVDGTVVARFVYIGELTDGTDVGTGTVDVSATGLIQTNGSTFEIGRFGNGTLNVNGGTVEVQTNDLVVGREADLADTDLNDNTDGVGTLNLNSGTIDIQAGDFRVDGGTGNRINVSGGTLNIFDDFNLADGTGISDADTTTIEEVDVAISGGVVNVGTGSGTGKIDYRGGDNSVALSNTGVLNLNGGNIEFDSSADVFTFSGGTLKDLGQFNSGSVAGVNLAQSGGDFQIGADSAISTSTVNGDYNMSGGTLSIDFASIADADSTNGGTGQDLLVVNGAVALTGGSLALSLPSGLDFTTGQEFTILRSTGGITGQFAEGTTITADGYNFVIGYNEVADGTGGNAGTDIVLRANVIPQVVSLSPTDDGTGVLVSSDLVVEFNTSIQAGTGNILITDATDGTSTTTIAITDPEVTISGSTLTINPSSFLDISTDYNIQIDGTAITEGTNNFVGISDTTTWNFTTSADAPPETEVGVSGGVLTISDILADNADGITITDDGSNYIIANATTVGTDGTVTDTDGDANSVTISKAGITSIVIDTVNASGDVSADTVTVGSDLSVAGSITITAETINLGASLTSTVGDITLNGSTTLSTDVSLTASEAGAGDVMINGATNLGASTLTVNSAGTAGTATGIISGAGALTKGGDGTFSLAGANTYNGTTTISAGALDVGAGGSGAVSGDVSVASGAILRFNNDSTTTFGGIISGDGAVEKTGGDQTNLTLSGANTYTGTTTISEGMIIATDNSSLGAGSASVSVANDSSLRLDNVTITGKSISITGTGEYFGGAVHALGTSTWDGDVVLAASNARLGATSGSILTVTGDISEAAAGYHLRLNGGGGTGVVFLASSANLTYTGNTNMVRGILRIGKADQLPAGTTLNIDDATASDNSTFDLNGFDQAVAGLTQSNTGGTGASIVSNDGASAATLTVTGTSSYSGILQDGASAVNLATSGSGTLTLTGASTHTGNTTIGAGTTVVLDAAGALGTSTIGGTGTLDVTTATSPVAGTFDPGASAGTIGALSVQGNLDLDGGVSVGLNNVGTAGTDYDQIGVTGTVDLTGATLDVTLGFVPTTGNQFVILSNDDTEAITGTFSGLAEGATATFGIHQFTVSYAGGTDANDVVLTYTGALAQNIAYVDDDFTASNGTLVDGDQETALPDNATIGTDAFTSIAAAIGSLNGTEDGTVVINSGTYDETLDLAALYPGFNLTLIFVEGDSTVTSLTTPATDSVVLGGSDGNHATAVQLTLGKAATAGDFEIASVVSGTGSITKIGTGTATLSADNTYEGATNVTEGVAKAGHANAFGATGTGTTVTDGGAVDTGGLDLRNETFTISGTGTGAANQGALFASAYGGNHGFGTVIMAGDASIGSPGSGNRFDVKTTITHDGSGPYTLTKVGANFVGISGLPTLLQLNIADGGWGMASNNGFNNVTGKDVVISDDGYVNFFANTAVDANFTLTNGGELRTGGTGVSTVSGTITLVGTGNELAPASTNPLSISSVISGSGELTLVGAGSATLSGANTFTGDTTVTTGTLILNTTSNPGVDVAIGGDLNVTGGTVQLSAADQIANTATVDIATAGIVDMNGFNDSVSGLLYDSGAPNVTGDYGSTSSAAPGGNQSDTFFTAASAGILTVADIAAPILTATDIVDAGGGADATLNVPVTYTVTFSEDIDHTTISTGDFSDFRNAGTATITLDSVVETATPGVFTVVVTPTTLGTLQLEVPVGATITDAAGNALVTTSAITDDTTITVAAIETTVAVVAGELVITDDNGGTSKDDLTITQTGDVITITDSALTVGAGTGVTQVNGNTVEIDIVAAGITNIVFDGLVGTDTVTIGSDVNLGAGALSLTAETVNVAGTITTTGAVTLTTPAVNFTNTTAISFDHAITGATAVTQSGAATTTLTATNTHTGGTTIDAGSGITVGDGATSGQISGAVTNNGTLTFDRSDDIIFSDTISGSGTIAQVGINDKGNFQGGARLELSGDNSTFTGNTTIGADSEILVSHANALGTTGTLSILGDDSTVRLAAGITTNSGVSFTFDNNSGVRKSMTVEGAGTATWAGDVVSTGGAGSGWRSRFTADAGSTLVLTGQISGGSGFGIGTFNGIDGTVEFAGSVANTTSGTIYTYDTITALLSVDDAIGTGNVTMIGGAFELGDGVTLANNIFVDDRASAGHGVQVGAGDSATYSGDITINEETVADPLAFGAGAGGTLTISGVIADDGAATTPIGINKTGDGTVILTNTNTYTGATSVDAGTLLVDGSTVAASAVSVAAGATLGGSGTINGTINSTGGTLQPGSAASTGILNTTAAVTLDGSSTMSFRLGGTTAGTQHDQLDATALVTLGSATLDIVIDGFTPLANGTETFTIINNTGSAVAGEFAQGTTSFISNGYTYTVDYAGGVGSDDVVLTLVGKVQTFYVDDSFGVGPAVDGDTEQSGTQSATIGTDAFTTIGGAISTLSGTDHTIIVVNSGNYDETIDLSAYGGNIELQFVGGDSTITSLAGEATDMIKLGGFDSNHTTAVQLTLGKAATAGDFEIASVVSGTGGITKIGTGTATLSGDNTYEGATNISEGVLKAGHINALGATTVGTTVTDGGALDTGGVDLRGDTITISGNGTGEADRGAVFTSIYGVGNLGIGQLILTGDASIGGDIARFDVKTSITGAGHTLTKVGGEFIGISGTPTLEKVIIADGGWGMASNNAFNNVTGKDVEISGDGYLNLFGNSAVDANFTLSNGGTIRSNGTGTSTVSGTITLVGTGGEIYAEANNPNTISSTISGSGGLTKTNAGIATLTGTNTYTGDTTVSAGTLALNSSGTAIAGDLNIGATGTVQVVADDQIAGGTTVDITTGGSLIMDGNDTVGAFEIDNTDQGSGAFTNTTAGITGAGTLTVANIAPTLGATPVLTISEGATVAVDAAAVGNPTDSTDADAALTVTVSAISGGQFERTTAAGTAITTFTVAEVTGGTIQFVHDGGEATAAYSVVVTDDEAANSGVAQAATVTFSNVNDSPVLGATPALTISEGATVAIAVAAIGTPTDADDADAALTVTVSGVSGGQFERTTAAGTAITTFTVAEVSGGTIQFVHDGGEATAAYSVVVADDEAANSGVAQAATVTFSNVNDSPVLGAAPAFTISEGATVAVDAAAIGTPTDADDADAVLMVTVSAVSGGQFERTTAAGTPITTFTVAEATGGTIQFVHDGGEATATYSVVVADDEAANSGAAQAATVTFTNANDSPVIAATPAMTITEGATVAVDAAAIGSPTDADDADADLTVTVSGVSGGQFERTTAAGTSITTFTVAEVSGGTIQFVHDGGEATAAYSVVVADDEAANSGVAQAATVTFTNANDSPAIAATPAMTITEGATVAVDAAAIGSPTDADDADAALTVTVSGVSGGQFERTTAAGTSITTFTVAEVSGGTIQFVHDGGEATAAYSVVVADDEAANSGAAQAATVTFTNANDSPVIAATPAMTITEGATVAVDAAAIGSPTDADDTDANLTVTVSGVSGGQFERTTAAGTGITTFTVAEVGSGTIQFVHDGGEATAAYSVVVADDDAANSGVAQAATVTFSNINDAPTLVDFNDTTSHDTFVGTPSNVDAPTLASILDQDSSDFSGGVLTITQTTANATGSFSLDGTTVTSGGNAAILATETISVSGTDIGTVNSAGTLGTDLQITFTANATAANIATLLQNLKYAATALGTVTYNATLTDGDTGTSAVSTFNINVVAGNTAPVATDNTAAITEDAAPNTDTGNVITDDDGNGVDSDADTDPITVTLIDHASATAAAVGAAGTTIVGTYGSLLINETGAYTYTLDNGDADTNALTGGQTVTDTFTYTLSDTSSSIHTADLVVTVTGANDSPAIAATPALTISEGGTVAVNAAAIGSPTDPDDADANLTVTVSGVSGGQFERTSAAGTAISTFTVAEVTGGAVQFVHDGGETTAAYSVVVADDGAANSGAAQAATVTFTNVNDSPVLGATPALTISEGGTVAINAAAIGSPTDPDDADSALTVTVSAVTGGQFERTTAAGTAITTFTVAEVTGGTIQFVHDGGEATAAYSAVVADDEAANSGAAQAATVTFTNVNDSPVLGATPALTVSEGATVPVDAAAIGSPTDADDADADLTVTVSGVSGGQFERTTAAGTAITAFTVDEVTGGTIQFVHDGGEATAAYSVAVADDGAANSGAAQAATVTFTNANDSPVLGATPALTISEGGTVAINAAAIGSPTDPDDADSALTVTVSGVTGGQFERTTAAGTAITTFTVAEVTGGTIQFVHDGGEATAAYSAVVADDEAANSGAAQAATVTFSNVNDSPVLGATPALTVSEGATVPVDAAAIGSPTDADDADADLTVTVSGVSGGQFERTSAAGTAITAFTVDEVTGGTIQFVHDGGEATGAYSVTVADDGAANSGAAQAATVTFSNTNDAPALGAAPALAVSEGQTVAIGAAAVGSPTDPDDADAALTVTVSGVTGGQFESTTAAGTAITTFTLADVAAGTIQFVHDGGTAAPTYDVQISDDEAANSGPAASVNVTFNPAPPSAGGDSGPSAVTNTGSSNAAAPNEPATSASNPASPALRNQPAPGNPTSAVNKIERPSGENRPHGRLRWPCFARREYLSLSLWCGTAEPKGGRSRL